MKQTYYVATRVLFVLVPAANEAEARDLGQIALNTLYHARFHRAMTAEIRAVRLATDDEIAFAHDRQGKGRRAVPASAELLMRGGGELTTEFL